MDKKKKERERKRREGNSGGEGGERESEGGAEFGWLTALTNCKSIGAKK